MNRGEIWSINLDPSVGAEIRRTKPTLILSVDAIGSRPLRIVMSTTGWKDKFRQATWLDRIETDKTNNIDKPAAADTFQVRSVSETRFVVLHRCLIVAVAEKPCGRKIIDLAINRYDRISPSVWCVRKCVEFQMALYAIYVEIA